MHQSCGTCHFYKQPDTYPTFLNVLDPDSDRAEQRSKDPLYHAGSSLMLLLASHFGLPKIVHRYGADPDHFLEKCCGAGSRKMMRILTNLDPQHWRPKRILTPCRGGHTVTTTPQPQYTRYRAAATAPIRTIYELGCIAGTVPVDT
jgi:hypothetical protein